MTLDHRQTSLLFLRNTGLIPVKVRPGQKDPFPDWDPRRAANTDVAKTLAAFEADPTLNIAALFSGRYVDVDVDSPSETLGAALNAFLPPTPFVWGRGKRLRSHRCYNLTEDFDRTRFSGILRFIKAHPTYSVEVRGGKPENGLYSVLPGSLHPSGDEYQWAGGVDLSVSAAAVSAARLIKGIRLAVACSMIADRWHEGSRNDLSLALAGTLWRIRRNSMAVYGIDHDDELEDDSLFLLTEDDATHLLTVVMEIADDDEGDRRSRLLNFRNTWQKLEKDETARVTGGVVLAQLLGDEGETIVRALYRLLSDSDGAEQLERLAQRFCIWYGPGVLIDTEMVEHGSPTPWMTREQAKNSMGGERIVLGTTKIPVVNLLFGSGVLQRVKGITFDPSTSDRIVMTDEGPKVNQWRGFATQPSSQRVLDEQVQPFISYIKEVLADGDEAMAAWITAWLADVVQHPADKPGTALVLVGEQGAGKSFLGEKIMGPIIGPTHYSQTNSITQLTNKFNALMDNKIFLQCDEAIHSYQRDVAAKLKSLITEKSMTIEPKGVNAYKKPNHIHFLFTSNEEGAALFIDATPHERRFTVARVSSARARDIEYWDHMHTWVEANLPKILRWLQDYKYDRKLIRRPLDTQAKRAIQRVGVDPEVSWIVNRIRMGFPLADRIHQHWWQAYNEAELEPQDRNTNTRRRDVWPDRIHVGTLEEDLKAYVRSHGRSTYSGNLTTTIRRVLPEGAFAPAGQIVVRHVDERSGQVTRQRVRVHTFPSVEDILAHLRRHHGPAIDELVEGTLSDTTVVGTEEHDDDEESEY